MRLLIILTLLVSSSCTYPDKRRHEKRALYETQLTHFKDTLSNLMIEHEQSESYIATAEVHQVTRSPEEKGRQLKNLKDYRTELERRIRLYDSLIAIYTDSLSLTEIAH
jgi:regulator of sigma D